MGTENSGNQKPSTTWYYYDSDGQRQGPISGGRLKRLAKTGRITPGTMVEAENGKVVPAVKIQGLTFVAAVSFESAPVTSVARIEDTSTSPFVDTTANVYLDGVPNQPMAVAVPLPVVEKAQNPSTPHLIRDLFKKPVPCAIAGFVMGLLVMLVCAYIYCGRESYQQAVAEQYIQKKMGEAFMGIATIFDESFNEARNIGRDVAQSSRLSNEESEQPMVLDPRLEQVKIDNFKLNRHQAQFSPPEINFGFRITNGSSKAVKTFTFDIVVNEPGRSVQGLRIRIRHSPPGGVEPGEIRSFTNMTQQFGDWDMLLSKDLAALEVTTTVTSIAFHDDEEIRR
jgi:hypothetical protein